MKTWIKEKAHLIQHGTSLEADLSQQKGHLTPADHFFVCNSGSTPDIDAAHYTLNLFGNALSKPEALSYSDLLLMPQRTVPAVLECAGNHRQLFEDTLSFESDFVFAEGSNSESKVKNQQLRPIARELMWHLGGVGMAEWSGVSLGDVMERVGVQKDALQICVTGGEHDSSEGEIEIVLPMAKAMDPDTLLATHMNGTKLPADHGFPVRLLVPGWVGAYSVKWLQSLEVSSRPFWVRRNTISYVMIGERWPARQFSPALGAPVTKLNLRSSLALPRPASLGAGLHRLQGYARSSGEEIDSVEWTEDGGVTWHKATLDRLPDRDQYSGYGKYAWVRFEFDWQARTGERVLMTRAIDSNGVVQPDKIPFNEGGYLFNAIHPHAITVF